MQNLSSSLPQRTELINALYQAGRELSTTTVLFHTAVAEQVGLNATEWKCLDVLRRGALTAGELATLTGLTTGAITGIIDRLEQAGFVRRERDPHDRRKVIVQPVQGHKHEILRQIFDVLMQKYAELFLSYSDQELAFILDYLIRSSAVMQEATTEMRQDKK